jgi:hypothetical protein
MSGYPFFDQTTRAPWNESVAPQIGVNRGDPGGRKLSRRASESPLISMKTLFVISGSTT